MGCGVDISKPDFWQVTFNRSCLILEITNSDKGDRLKMKKKKVMFFGAGVLGSLYAARMHEAGQAYVTLVARGSRYEDLKKYGVVLENFDTGKKATTKVNVIDHVPRDEYFDYCVVLVQKTQLDSALEALKVNPHIPAFVFMNNTVEGPGSMIEALGREQVMMGHANAGGERNGHVVLYMITEKMTLGELDGSKSKRLLELSRLFEAADFPVDRSSRIDAWKKVSHCPGGTFCQRHVY